MQHRLAMPRDVVLGLVADLSKMHADTAIELESWPRAVAFIRAAYVADTGDLEVEQLSDEDVIELTEEAARAARG